MLLKNVIIILLLFFNFLYAKDVIISSSTVVVNIEDKFLEKERKKEEKRRIKEEKKAQAEKIKKEKAMEKEIVKQEKLKKEEEKRIKLEEKNIKEFNSKEKDISNNLNEKMKFSSELNEKKIYESKQKEELVRKNEAENVISFDIEKDTKKKNSNNCLSTEEAKIDKVEDSNIRGLNLDSNFKLKPIYFDNNSVFLNYEYQKILNSNIDWLKSNTNYRVLIVGYTDKIGKKEYNIKLGQDRANKIKKYLTLAGIDSSKIETISFGEESSTYNLKNDKDRKVEIFIYKN